MSKEFYVTINFSGHSETQPALAGRCMKVLHGYTHHRELNNIGVTFPNWNNETIGQSIAFVSQMAADLKDLISQKSIKFMQNNNFINIDAIGEVPESCERVQFRRCTEAGKNTLSGIKSRLKRAKKRAESRGEVYINDLTEIQRESPHHHRIPITSQTKDDTFSLLVERVSGMAIDDQENNLLFGRYGLSGRKQFKGTVPYLLLS